MQNITTFGVYQVLVDQEHASRKVIISFSGIGGGGGQIHFESVHSFRRIASEYNTIYVRDLSRSWYSNKNGYDELVSFIKKFIRERGIDHVVTFGISMGGFGAAVIGREIGAHKAIALSPRTLIGKKCTFDNRNLEYASKVGCVEWDDMRDLLIGLPLILFFSIDQVQDVAHASRLLGTSAKLVATRGDHNIARTLKSCGMLDGFLLEVLSNQGRFEEFGFFEADPLIYDLATNKLRAALVNKIIDLPETMIPEFLYPDLYNQWIIQHFENPPVPYIAVGAAVGYPAHTRMLVEAGGLMPYLGVGWASPEYFGFWGVGNVHSVKFRMASVDGLSSFRVTIGFKVFASPNAPSVRYSSQCNGERPIDQGTEDELTTLTFIAKERNIEVLIVTPVTVSPKSLGLGDDERQLSIALHFLRID